VTGVLTVRTARAEELDAAGEVVADAYRGQPGMDAEPWYLERVRDARGRAADVEVLVAVDGEGRVLGCVSYVAGPDSAYAEVERDGEAGFRMLGVAPDAQGRGIGTALVEACVDRARSAGRSAVAITTEATWAGARRLYERLGFRRDPGRDFEPVPGIVLVAYVLDL
jgi:GNAT superfamily N-acetyltransferase